MIVIDNASPDDSADAIEAEFGDRVELVRHGDNIGFARANNLMIETRAIGEWVLLLNPDTEVFPGSIDALLDFGKAHPEGGIYGGRTVFPDGSLNIASCWNDMTPWSLFCSATGLTNAFRYSRLFDTEAIGGFQRDAVRHVDIVVGCLLLCKRELWNRLEGFDTSYWMYGDDTDLCIRARLLGYRPMITPDATIMHIVGASSAQRAEKFVLVARARVTIVQRYWSPLTKPWGIAMLWLSPLVHRLAFAMAAAIDAERYGEKKRFWDHIWKTRREWLQGYPPNPQPHDTVDRQEAGSASRA